MSVATNSSKRIKELDGLRGLAVLLVLVNHFNQSWLTGGFIGVDIFFVLSGYVVTLSVLKRKAKNIGNTIIEFYKRRFIRILPALILCILITTLFSVLFIPKSWLSQSLETTGIWSIVGASNIAQILTNDGYFAPISEFNPFTHAWSLGIEEQFYLLIPFILIYCRPRKIAYIVGILSVVSLVLGYSWSSSNQNLAFYSLFSRFWELGIGVLLAIYFDSKFANKLTDFRFLGGRIGVSFLSLLFGLVFIGLSSVFQTSTVLTPWPGSLLPVLGASLVIVSTFYVYNNSFPDRTLRQVIANPFLLWFGFISYALYLWHWPVIVVMKWTVGLNNILLILFGVALSIALACISTYIVEYRFQRCLKFGNVPVVGAALLSVVLGTLTVKALFDARSYLSLSTVNINYRQWYAESPLDNRGDDTLPTIFVVGDSHALAYAPLLELIHLNKGWNTRILALGRCAPGSIMRPGSKSAVCTKNVDNVISLIKSESKPNDIVWLASLRMYRYIQQGDAAPGDLSSFIGSKRYQDQLQLGIEEAKNLISDLSGHQLNVLIDRPKPLFKAHPFRCSDWFNRSNHICDAGLTLAQDEFRQSALGVNNAIDELKNDYPSLIVWDPSQILCGQDFCNSMDGDKPVFFDADHLSRYGNRLLFKSFNDKLNQSSCG